MALQPNYPMVNLGDLYVQGGRLSYASTTTFTVAAGQFRDSTNINDIVLPAAATVNIAVTGINGLDTGTIAASSVYYVYAIGSSVFGANDGQDYGVPQAVGPIPGSNPAATGVPSYPSTYAPAGILISLAAPSVGPKLPVNYDMFRRIGAIRTTAGSLIEPFVQTGYGQNRTMRFQTPVAPVGAAVAGTTAFATIGALVTVIPQIAMDVIVDCSLAPATAGDLLYLAPYGNTAAPGGNVALFSAPVIQPAIQHTQLVCPCASNAGVMEVDYATTAGAGTTAVTFAVAGYVDTL